MGNKRLLRWYHYLGAIVLIIVIIALLAIFNNLKLGSKPAANVPVTDGHDMIVVNEPASGAKISSPIIVKGQARGNWYFEATFPIVVVDWDGRIIGEGHATAKSDWMTTGYVPFEGTIDFKRPADVKVGTYNERGSIILRKDNPSGLPANDAAVEIPVVFQ